MTALPGVRHANLRTKIIVWAFVPTAILLNLITWFTFYTYQKVTEELVVERNRELTRLLAAQLSTLLTDYADLLIDLAAQPQVYTGDASARQAALASSSAELRVFDGGVAILDLDGNLVAANGPLGSIVGQNWSDRPYAHIQEGTRFQFSNIQAPGPYGPAALALTVPVRLPNGPHVAALVGLFEIDTNIQDGMPPFYTALLREMHGWAGGDFYLVDGTGRAIYHTHSARTGEAMTAQDGVQQLLAGQTGAFRTRDLAGIKIVIGFAPVAETPWGLVTEDDWEGLASASQRYRYLLIIFLLTGLLVPILLVVLGVRQITRPIRELIGAAQEVAEGDFDQKIVAETGDELQDLADQFNHMASRLRELYANLEQRGADRTRELSALYQVATVARASLNLSEILDQSLDQVLAVMECKMGMVHLFDEESGRLRLAAWHGIPPEKVTRAPATSTERGLIAWVFEQHETVIMPQIADSPHPFLTFSVASDQTYAGAPMRTTEQTLGVLSIIGSPGQQFSLEEQALLAAVADQIAVTVENVRLRAEAEQVALLQERERLARDLHDSVTQSLYSLTLWIEAGQRSVRAGDLARVEEYLERLEEGTRQAIRDMRLLVYELRPPALEYEGLVSALQERLDAVEKRSGIQARLVVQGDLDLPPKIEEGLYRIAQEALNNALKHAGASVVVVRLQAGSENIELEVIDNGSGFDRDAIGDTGGMGLKNMQQRAAQLDGTLCILSRPGEGTHIRAVIPKNGRFSPRMEEEKDE